MAVENVNSKPIAASAAVADYILASIGGKVRRVPISTLADTLTDAEVALISAAASALVSAAGKASYIGSNENWFVWDGTQGKFVDSGNPSRGARGYEGVVYTPHLSDAGVLSWTNDGGLPNPDPVSLLGPAGGVTSFKGRSGAVVPEKGDYTPELIGAEKANAVATHNLNADAHTDLFANKLNKDGDAGTLKPIFQQATERTSLESGLELKVLLGRIMKWLSDLGSAAFTSSENYDANGAGADAVSSHNDASMAHANLFANKLSTTGDASNTTAAFTAATTRTNLTTGEKMSVLLGKIAKWFADLKTVAFTGAYNDLSGKPDSLPASDVSAWAKAATKPSYSASEVGADASGTVNTMINRTNAVSAANASYATLMARGEKLLPKATFDAVTDWSTHLVNGAIVWGYE